MANPIGDLAITISANLNPLVGAIGKVPGMLAGLGRDLIRVGMFEVGRKAADLVFGTPADFLSDSVKLAAAWERNTTQFEVFLGSGERAMGLMQDLRKFASESPLTLSDSVAEAKKLLASGISRNQIVPTLEMLSDLSVGNQYTLHALTKAYTDVIAAGRLYGTELRQFTETGIPLIEALADTLKKPKEEIRFLMEAGKVGSVELVAALKSLTGEGGKFYHMTRRGSQTLEGQFERLRDAAEELKREFGRAVIEEVGLKDATQDAMRFTDEMKGFVNDLRPALRWVGELGRGVFNVVGEVARNAPLFARGLGEGLRAASPHLADMVDKAGDFVRAMRDFRIDPRAAVEAGLVLARALGEAIETVLDTLGDGLADIYNKNFKPFVEDMKELASSIQNIKRVMDAAAKPVKDAGFHLGREWEKEFGGGPPPTEKWFVAQRRREFDGFYDAKIAAFNANQAKMAAVRNAVDAAERGGDPKDIARTREAASTIWKEVNASNKALIDAYEKFAARRDDVLETEYRAKWTMTREQSERAQLEFIPAMEKARLKAMQEFAAVVKKAGIDTPIKFNGAEVKALEPEMAGPRSQFAKAFADMEARLKGWADGVADEAKKRRSDAAAAAPAFKDPMAALTGGLGAAPFAQKDDAAKLALGAFAGATAMAADEIEKLSVALPGLASKYQNMLIEMRDVVADPARQFADKWNDLVVMRDLGKAGKLPFGEREFALASNHLFKEFGGRLGEASRVRLPDAAEYGSRQAAELWQRAMAGGPVSTATLLQQLIRLGEQQVAEAKAQTQMFTRGQEPKVIDMGLR